MNFQYPQFFSTGFNNFLGVLLCSMGLASLDWLTGSNLSFLFSHLILAWGGHYFAAAIVMQMPLGFAYHRGPFLGKLYARPGSIAKEPLLVLLGLLTAHRPFTTWISFNEGHYSLNTITSLSFMVSHILGQSDFL